MRLDTFIMLTTLVILFVVFLHTEQEDRELFDEKPLFKKYQQKSNKRTSK